MPAPRESISAIPAMAQREAEDVLIAALEGALNRTISRSAARAALRALGDNGLLKDHATPAPVRPTEKPALGSNLNKTAIRENETWPIPDRLVGKIPGTARPKLAGKRYFDNFTKDEIAMMRKFKPTPGKMFAGEWLPDD